MKNQSLGPETPRGGEAPGQCFVHDLRRVFTVRLHWAKQDVYQVEKALGHANVVVTEGDLRSLGLREKGGIRQV